MTPGAFALQQKKKGEPSMDVVYAKHTGPVTYQGAPYPVRKGSHWPASDPVVAENPHMFSADPRYGMLYTVEPEGYDAPVDDTPVVESATAVPGERRSVRRPRALVE